jgi:hypothetical protein
MQLVAKHGILLAAVVAVLGGCGDDSSKASGSDGGASGSDAGSKSDAGGTRDGGAATLCDKYGGTSAVGSVITKFVLPKISGDCRINSFFADLPADHMQRLSDCLSIQAEELFGCAGVKYVGAKASNGFPCRSMKEAHKFLKIGSGDFDALIEDVAAGLAQAGVEQKDISAAAPALVGLESDIVEQPASKQPTMAMCTEDGGAADGG